MKKHLRNVAVFLLTLLAVPVAMADNSDYLESYNVQRAQNFMKNDVDEAMKFLNKEIKSVPENGYAWLLLARCMQAGGDYNTRLEYTTKAIEKLRDVQKDNAWLASAYTERAAIYSHLERYIEEMQDLDDAVKCAEKLKGRDVNIEPLIARGHFYFREQDYVKSTADFKKASTIDDASPLPLVGMGRNADAQGRYDEAVNLLKQAVFNDPHYRFSHYYLVAPYLHKGDYQLAAEKAVECLDYEQVQSAIIAYMVDSMIVKASGPLLQEVSRNAGKHSTDPIALFAHYQVLCAMNRDREAYLAADNLLKLDPENESYALYAARAARAGGLYQEAMDMAKKIYDKNSKSLIGLREMALASIDMGQYDDARQYLQSAMDLYPDNADLYYLSGALELETGNAAAAIEKLELAKLLNPNSPAVREELVCAYVKADRDKDMRREAEEALALDNEPNLLSSRHIFLSVLGRYEEALQWLDKIQAVNPFNALHVSICKAEVYALKGDNFHGSRTLFDANKAGYKRFDRLKKTKIFQNHQDFFEDL